MLCTAGSSSVACAARTELAVARQSLQPWGWPRRTSVQSETEDTEVTGMVCDPLCSLRLLGYVQALPPPWQRCRRCVTVSPPSGTKGVLLRLSPGRKQVSFPLSCSSLSPYHATCSWEGHALGEDGLTLHLSVIKFTSVL